MDTRFWGPPAWKLLHTIAAAYEPAIGRQHMIDFLEVLPFILPCKFCRASLTDHYKRLPFRGTALTSREAFEEWMYKLHNLVNDKLEEQGQHIGTRPAFSDVRAHYREILAGGTPMPWDFLFAVAFIYPPTTPETPIPDAPKCRAGAADCEKNRWNYLSPTRRLAYWRKFWKVLPGVLPATWRSAWVDAVRRADPAFTSRRSAVASLWRIRCAFESNKEDPYTEVCDRLVFHSSGCGIATAAKTRTCRRLQQRRQTRKHNTRQG